MKRRILSLLLVLALTAGLLPAVQAADSFQLTYKEISDPSGLEITGCIGTIPQKLVIPETIDGKNVVAIGNSAFLYAYMEELVLPNTVIRIGESAFRGCESLHSVTLGAVEMIGSLAFFHCTALTSVTLPATLREMGDSCFSGCAVQSVTICEGAKSIGNRAFASCRLEGTVIVPESITAIGYGAFEGNDKISTLVSYSDSVIPDNPAPETCTVYYASAQTPDFLEFDDRVISFAELPYDPTAEAVTEGPVTYILSDGVACVIKCTAEGNYTLPDTLGGCPVGVIGPFAFSNATDLVSITLPDSITQIGRCAFSGSYPTVTRLPKSLTALGAGAFHSSRTPYALRISFRDGTIPDGITEIPMNAFSNARFSSLTLPAGLETIGNSAFSGIQAVSVSFSGSVREIGQFAFSTVKLDSLELPEGLESIGDHAFYGCTMDKLLLPHSLQKCGDLFGFYATPSTVVCGYTDTPVFDYCKSQRIAFLDRETGTLYGAPYETTQGGVRYYVYPGDHVLVCGVVTGCPQELVIPETVDGTPVTGVNDWAFTTDAVRSVYLPDTVTTLCDMAFIDCKNLESLRLSENLESIGSSCFDNCLKLKYLYIPASVTSFSDLELPIGYSTVALFDAGTYAQSCLESHTHWSCTLDPDADYVSEGNALCRIEGDSAVLVALRPIIRENNTCYYEVPDTAAGYPVTAIDGNVKLFAKESVDELFLGRNVATIGEGVLKGSRVHTLYTYPALSSLPDDILVTSSSALPEIYGFTGSYAEAYCAAHSITFRAIDAVPFTDVPEDSWYYPWVFSCYWAGYMNGTSATTFSPGGTTSRAMLVTVLYRMCGQYVSEGNPFHDVPYDSYYYDPVSWAQACGVVYGTSATTFSPNDPITREQTATILYRLGSLMGADVDSYTPLTRFRDGAAASEYARSALMWAVDAGILQGNEKGELDPLGSTTRAQMAAIIVRYVDWLVSEGLR